MEAPQRGLSARRASSETSATPGKAVGGQQEGAGETMRLLFQFLELVALGEGAVVDMAMQHQVTEFVGGVEARAHGGVLIRGNQHVGAVIGARPVRDAVDGRGLEGTAPGDDAGVLQYEQHVRDRPAAEVPVRAQVEGCRLDIARLQQAKIAAPEIGHVRRRQVHPFLQVVADALHPQQALLDALARALGGVGHGAEKAWTLAGIERWIEKVVTRHPQHPGQRFERLGIGRLLPGFPLADA